MNSALKPPVGVQPSPVPQLNKQNVATYGQPMSHIPQNLSPANAHSNNIHPSNHYSSVTNAPSGVGNLPPPSNHPTQSKNITYSLNANNVLIHSYKAAPTENVFAALNDPEKPQSNGTALLEKPPEKETTLQNHQPDSIVKDKPKPTQIDTVPETALTSANTDVEVDKPVEAVAELPVETTPKVPDEASITESAATSKPVTEDLPVEEEPVASTPSVESSPPVASAVAEAQPEKVDETEILPETAGPSGKQTTPVSKPKETNMSKPTLKLATTRSPIRKNKFAETTEPKTSKTPPQKSPSLTSKTKRTRFRTQPYQSPLPEVEMISKISASASISKPKCGDDKLIVFYKNEFLAVRNPEGGFYLCQAMQNIYKSTRKLRILWLTQDKSDGDIYTPDFYDQTDFDCILTNINLTRISKGKFKLPDKERIRTDSILKRALAAEKGDATLPYPTEEHPDGLDLSLYKEESQLKKRKGKKRKASAHKSPPETKLRRLEPRTRAPPVAKAVVIKKALAVKAKETATTSRSTRLRSMDAEPPKAAEQKKGKAVVKKQPPPAPSAVPSTSKSQPPRKQSVKSDTVVPFLRKEPPVLKKEAGAKREYLVLKKESALKKEVPVKKEPGKRGDAKRREMPVLKKEAPLKKEGGKQILTRKSARGKK